MNNKTVTTSNGDVFPVTKLYSCYYTVVKQFNSFIAVVNYCLAWSETMYLKLSEVEEKNWNSSVTNNSYYRV